MPATSSIYEPQRPQAGGRTCGAAALCMVYRALGRDCSQADIWTRLCQAGQTRGGVRTHRLAADVLSAGLSAVVVQTDLPWELLHACSSVGLQVILNHRLAINSPWGHYSVLSRIDSHTAWIHDPQFGPSRPIARDELLQLWQRAFGRSEIRGNVAVLIDQRREQDSSGTTCLNCQAAITRDPLGRLDDFENTGNLWRYSYCPACDWSTERPKIPMFTSRGECASYAMQCNATN